VIIVYTIVVLPYKNPEIVRNPIPGRLGTGDKAVSCDVSCQADLILPSTTTLGFQAIGPDIQVDIPFNAIV
jgi:hypothetical protein